MPYRIFVFVSAIFVLTGCAAAIVTGAATSSEQAQGADAAEDAKITSAVKTALLRDPVVTQFDIRVTTYSGTVTLAGAVHGDAVRATAERLARQVKGVQRVVNELVIEP